MNTLKKDFYSANEELKQIYENSLTQRNKNQIKSNLVDAINKVIKEITLNVMALENSIEKGFSDDHIYLFNSSKQRKFNTEFIENNLSCDRFYEAEALYQNIKKTIATLVEIQLSKKIKKKWMNYVIE